MEIIGSAIQTGTTYEPYGKLLVQTGTNGTVYGYTGEQYDAATSLVYLRARYYNPNLKLFMSRDPFPGWIGLPASQHPYSYVHNNPVNYTDPSGNCIFGLDTAICIIAAGGLVIGFVAGTTWNVMVVQGKGGISDLTDIGKFFDPDYYCDVNWPFALFTGAIGGALGGITGGTLGLITTASFPHFPESEFPDSSNNSKDDDRALEDIGSLPKETAREIQNKVDEIGEPVYVVGGYARGEPHPRKDIDYYIDVEDREAWGDEKYELPGDPFEGTADFRPLNSELFGRPGVRPPYIKFIPGQEPIWVRE